MAQEISAERLGEVITAHLKTEFEEAAEHIIQAAIAGFEIEIRKQVAVTVLAAVEGSYSMERMGPDIRITVRRPQ